MAVGRRQSQSHKNIQNSIFKTQIRKLRSFLPSLSSSLKVVSQRVFYENPQVAFIPILTSNSHYSLSSRCQQTFILSVEV